MEHAHLRAARDGSIAQTRVRTIRPGSSEWPARLSELGGQQPPKRLFAAGLQLDRDDRCIAIVGTRRPSAAGLETARRFARGFVEAGFTVVSGLAVGIDAAAHEATLDSGGKTVAVLGCGLDVAYPRRNMALRHRITAGGTIVSEYPDGTPPRRENFPARNRIIAGLALGVVVVEGAVTSGALVTARLALDANRGVYAVPGSLRNPMAAGPHELIRTSGALLVTEVADVFADLGPNLAVAGIGREVLPPPVSIDDDQGAVLGALDDVPSAIDALARATGMLPGRVAVTLAGLEMRGLAMRSRGGFCITEGGARSLAAGAPARSEEV
jgi:DNA processing protein